MEDPASAWTQGLLDDYPAVNLDFWNHLKANAASSFDKLQSLERILGRVIVGDLPLEMNAYKAKIGRILVKRAILGITE